METGVLLIALVVIVMGTLGLFLLIRRLETSPASVDFSGIWLNESMNIRILLHEVDTVFQGSVIWANGLDRLLGYKVVENLKFNSSKKGKGKYSDPLTGQQYEINLTLKRKGIIQISAYLPNSEEVAFSQEWKQFVS